MSASLALAGVGACTKQPPETIVPTSGSLKTSFRAVRSLFASAMPISGTRCRCWSRATWGGRPKSKAIQSIRRAWAAPTSSTQASGPRSLRSRSRQDDHLPRRGPGWPRFVGAMQEALAQPEGAGRRRLHFLTAPITSPSLARLLGEVLRDYPAANGISAMPGRGRRGRRRGAPRGLPLRQGRRHRRARRRFPGVRPGSVRYSKDFARAGGSPRRTPR